MQIGHYLIFKVTTSSPRSSPHLPKRKTGLATFPFPCLDGLPSFLIKDLLRAGVNVFICAFKVELENLRQWPWSKSLCIFCLSEAGVQRKWRKCCEYSISNYLKIHCAFTFCGHNVIWEHCFNSMLYLEVLWECGALSLGNGVELGPSFFFFFNTNGSNFADQKSMNRTHCNGEQHLHRREKAVNSAIWGKSLSLMFALCKHDAISVS